MATGMKTKKKSKRTVNVPQAEMNEPVDNDTESEINPYQNTYLQQAIERYSGYSTIYLGFLSLNDRDTEIIVQQAIIKKQCKELWINESKLTSACASILANALNNTDNILENLSLYDNGIGDDGAYYFAKALSINTTIVKRLNIGRNGITNEGVKHLAEMIKTNETLIGLYINANKINNEGVRILANAVQYYNKTLIELDFCANDLINDSSVDSLILLIKHNQSLKKLSLFGCSFSQTGKDRLLKEQKRKEDFQLDI